MLRKILKACLTIVLVLAAFYGLYKWFRAPLDRVDDRTEDGRLIVDYWEKWTGFEGDAMQAVVDDFNASQDRIFVRKLTVSQIERKFMLATAGSLPPDIVGLWSFGVPVYSEKNALTPLDSLLEEAGITKEDYIPVFWDLCKNRGHMWALPSTPASVALHWNKKMFREAGLDPEHAPQSLDELDKMGEQLTLVEVERDGKTVQIRFPDLTKEERDNYDFDIIKVGFMPSEPGWWNALWGFWFGAELWDGDRLVTCNDAANLETFTWFGSYTKKYGLANVRKFGAAFGNFASPQNPFLGEQVAMVLQGVWMFNFIDQYAPSMEWAVAPFPSKYPEKYPQTTLVECDILAIPNGARHIKEAFEFICYVNSQGPMEKLNLAQRKFSPLSDYSEDFVKNHPNPNIEAFIELAKSPNARYVPRISIYNEYSEEMVVACDQIFNNLKTPEEALEEVSKRVQWKFNRGLRRWDLVKEERMKQWSEQ